MNTQDGAQPLEDKAQDLEARQPDPEPSVPVILADMGLDQRLKNISVVWGKGRPKGAKNKRQAAGREFAENILTSPEYRASLVRRIQNDTLPPQVEVLLHHYAFGKPTENINISEVPATLDDCTNEELQQRAARIFERARIAALSEKTPEPVS